MTVVEEVPLYVRDGSRFVLYDERRQHTPPIPVPVSLDEAEVLPVEPDPSEWDADAVPTRGRPTVRTGPSAWGVYAARCPHGRFRGCKVRGCPGPS